MASFLEQIEDTFNSGDPEARTWFLVRQTYLPFAITGMYILFCTVIGPAVMKKKKPFGLRIFIAVYDFFLVCAYIVCVLTILWNVQYIAPAKWCKEQRIKIGEVTYTLIRTVWVIYILKYIELLDTVFFVLRKKNNQITFLHITHHTLVPITYWVIFRTERNGFFAIIGVINAAVHILMYTYYGVAAMGPQYIKYIWWKKYLTQLQMVQFILMIVLLSVVAPLFGCSMGFFSFMMIMFIAPLFLYLFYKFYKRKFKTEKILPITNVIRL